MDNEGVKFFGLHQDAWFLGIGMGLGAVILESVRRAARGLPSPDMGTPLVPVLGLSTRLTEAGHIVGRGILTGAGFAIGGLAVAFFFRDWIRDYKLK